LQVKEVAFCASTRSRLQLLYGKQGLWLYEKCCFPFALIAG
jgi:hypothetical protein